MFRNGGNELDPTLLAEQDVKDRILSVASQPRNILG